MIDETATGLVAGTIAMLAPGDGQLPKASEMVEDELTSLLADDTVQTRGQVVYLLIQYLAHAGVR